jgi:hypothetical protein
MARRFLLSAATAAALTLAAPLAVRPAWGQDVPPTVENSRLSAVCAVNADNVYVRSGAGDNFYPTMKLSRGDKVTVIGEKFEWLKVLPPDGSFCYIAKAFVEKTGDSTGKVNRDDVNVRAGSALNTMKTTVQSKLSTGDEVKILGEVDEYFRIAPPADAAVYVKKDFVDPPQEVKPQLATAAGAGGKPSDAAPTPEPAQPAEQAQQTQLLPPSQPVAEAPTPAAGPAEADAANGGPATQPAPTQVAKASGAAAPATQPSPEIQFDQLEADFAAASGKPIEQQPVTELLTGYQKLIANTALPESMRRVADHRAQTLKARAEAREQFLAVLRQQEEAKKKLEAFKSEQEEIAQNIKKNDVAIFTAVGTLRTSSLQVGPQAMYRLTDPANGRSVCYIRADDAAKYGAMLGQFVGVKGELSTDPSLNLKVVNAVEAAQVDPNQVFRGVGATIVPPSLLPQAAPPPTAAPQQASASEAQPAQ